MENLLFYFLKVILCSGVMFLYYRIFLKDKTFHHYNRFYLLGTLVVSLLLPFLKVSSFTINVNQDIYDLIRLLQSGNSSKTSSDGFTIYQVIFAVAALVSIFFIGKFILGLLKINKIKKQFPQEQFEGISFYNTNLENAPFSFFRNLFWKNSILIQSDLGSQILKHEMVHIEQKHTYDKILIEILTAVFWFNPIFYLIKKELNLIHEYLADKKALKNSDTKAFAQMLLETHFSGTILPATSPFLNSNLKKRLIMLKKSNTKFSYWRKVLALPLLFSLVFAYMVKAENREIKKSNYAIALAVSSLKIDMIKNDTIKKSVESEITSSAKQEELSKVQAMKDAKQARIDGKQAQSDAKLAVEASMQARIDGKKAQEDEKSAIVAATQARKDAQNEKANNEKYFYIASDSSSLKVKDVLYFIDGVKVNYDAVKNLKPDNIKLINVTKDNNGGQNQTHIFTKKSATSVNSKQNNPWIINIGAHDINPPRSKLTAISTFTPESEVDGNRQAVADKDLKDAKIYINGKLSDEKTAKSIKLKDIQSINISNATNNGYQYNKVNIVTK